MPNLVKSICLLVGGFAKEKTEQPATHKPHDAHVADVSWAKVRLVAKLGIDGDNLSMMRRPSQSHSGCSGCHTWWGQVNLAALVVTTWVVTCHLEEVASFSSPWEASFSSSTEASCPLKAGWEHTTNTNCHKKPTYTTTNTIQKSWCGCYVPPPPPNPPAPPPAPPIHQKRLSSYQLWCCLCLKKKNYE